MKMIQWKKICSLEDIPVLGSRRVARNRGMDIAIFRNASDEVFALLDRCPHKGGPLSQGIVSAKGVACPLHNWTIELDSGCAQAPDVGCTPSFACKLEEGLVYLDAAEIENHGIDLVRPIAGPVSRQLTA
jgi:nitrite reductase (NADH) small subunit